MLKNPEKTKNQVVAWIREYFDTCAPKASAVVGISGGKDSSVTAALLVEALGKDRVVGVTMPNGVQPDLDDSHLLLNHLGISYLEVNIHAVAEAFEDTLLNHTDYKNICKRDDFTPQTRINFPPRIRMTTLYAIAQSLPNGGLVANTCNRSEDYVGYSTKFGDAAGDFSPLANLTVHEVLQLGEVLGLPDSLVHKAPSDGLSGMTDEDKLGFTYATLDHYLDTGICEDKATLERIENLHRWNLHKLQPMPSFKPEE